MQTLLLRTFILILLAMGIAIAVSWKTDIRLRLQPQANPDMQQQLAAAREARAREAAGGNAVQPPANGQAVQPPDRDTTPPEVPGGMEVPGVSEGSPGPEPPPVAGAEGDEHVTVEQAFELFDLQFIDASQVIFIDARARTEYEKGHIEGAMSLPAGEFGAGRVPQKASNYLPGNIVIIYCQGAECHDSHDVAIRLQQANLQIAQIWIFKDGYPAWVAAGHPTATGPDQLWQ